MVTFPESQAYYHTDISMASSLLPYWCFHGLQSVIILTFPWPPVCQHTDVCFPDLQSATILTFPWLPACYHTDVSMVSSLLPYCYHTDISRVFSLYHSDISTASSSLFLWPPVCYESHKEAFWPSCDCIKWCPNLHWVAVISSLSWL